MNMPNFHPMKSRCSGESAAAGVAPRSAARPGSKASIRKAALGRGMGCAAGRGGPRFIGRLGGHCKGSGNPRAARRRGQRNLDLRRPRSDRFPVKTIPLGRILASSFLCLTFVGHALADGSNGGVVSLGDNTYSITKEAKDAFHREIEPLKAAATEAATKFCADQGKEMRVVSLTGRDPFFGLGYTSAKIVFRAVNPGEPDPAVAAVREQVWPLIGAGQVVPLIDRVLPPARCYRAEPTPDMRQRAALDRLGT